MPNLKSQQPERRPIEHGLLGALKRVGRLVVILAILVVSLAFYSSILILKVTH